MIEATELTRHFGARVAVAEVPPGPPVLQTLVAEVYAPTPQARLALASQVPADVIAKERAVFVKQIVQFEYPLLDI
mgnify:CR=1 FL=1